MNRNSCYAKTWWTEIAVVKNLDKASQYNKKLGHPCQSTQDCNRFIKRLPGKKLPAGNMRKSLNGSTVPGVTPEIYAGRDCHQPSYVVIRNFPRR